MFFKNPFYKTASVRPSIQQPIALALPKIRRPSVRPEASSSLISAENVTAFLNDRSHPLFLKLRNFPLQYQSISACRKFMRQGSSSLKQPYCWTTKVTLCCCGSETPIPNIGRFRLAKNVCFQATGGYRGTQISSAHFQLLEATGTRKVAHVERNLMFLEIFTR